MDIKDFILIGGGLLIAAVVAHGFWIAWRDRRQDLRIDIKPDLIPDEVNEIDRLRGELPNGGWRPAKGDYEDPQQDQLALGDPPPLLLEPTEPPPAATRRIEPGLGQVAERSPDGAIAGAIDESERSFESIRAESELVAELGTEADPDLMGQEGRAKVTEVALPEDEPANIPDPIVADEPKRPRRLGQRKASERVPSGRKASAGSRRAEEARAQDAARDVVTALPVEELIVMNVLSEEDKPYTGDELFTTLRTCGLKFGDMNIFHRVEPLTKAVQYSVASAVEPGTFDMADMEALRCPGLCLFMQLPGPEDPSVAFEDMLSVARSVTKTLGGDVRDEHRNVITPQTVEHYRQRVVDFSRRRMSRRA